MDDEMYVDAMKTHSDVVRPYAGDRQIALTINPYHLGFAIWDRIIRDRGETEARRVMVEEDDFGFVRNYLDADLARELDLFVYLAKQSGEVRVRETDLHELHEAILRPKYNFGAPRVYVDEFRSDGSLVLRHDHGGDGIGLDLEKARHVLDYVSAVWRRPVSLYTAGERGAEECLKSSKNG